MLLIFITALTVSFSFSIVLSSSPLTIGLWVLLLALALARLIALSISPWFGLTIFLIYVGGMLVIFAYFAALTPNQPHEILKIGLILRLTLIIIFTPTLYLGNLLESFLSYSSIKPELTILTPWSSRAFIIVVIILFFILVSVVKVADIFKGPLRPFY